MYCKNCGNEISDQAAICLKCGVATGSRALNNTLGEMNKSKTSYIVMGLLLGSLGIHNFYAGYSGKGIAQLLITILTGWLIIPLLGVWIWNVIEVCTVTKDAKGNLFT